MELSGWNRFSRLTAWTAALLWTVAAVAAGEAPAEPEPAPAGPQALPVVAAKVVTIDGKVTEGDITAADAESITVSTGKGPQQIKLENAIEINFELENKLRATGLQLLFLDGSTLNLEKIPGATEEKVKVASPTLGGEIELPVDRLMGVIFDVNAKRAREYRDAIMTRQVEHDFVLLPNVDSIAGRLLFAEWKDRAVAIEVDEQKREFKDEEAAGVKFQVLAEKTVPPPLHVIATLIDGSELVGVPDSVADGKLVLDVQSAKVALVTGGIRSLRVIGSRMRYLSELAPTATEEYPYLKQLPTAYPMHKNRTSAGKPISINGKPFAYGIGVHAHSHLSYSLDQKFEMFYTLVGIDDNMSRPGRVKYSVVVDGEVRKSGTLASKKADNLEVNVKGARKLELIVTFGDDSDQGDSVVWANARLIEKE